MDYTITYHPMSFNLLFLCKGYAITKEKIDMVPPLSHES